MRLTESFYRGVIGTEIYRRNYSPPNSSGAVTSPRGGALFLHGLGDHGGRHGRVLGHFAARGIHCVTVDLPGHGLSGETRGYLPSLGAVHELIAENLAYVQEKVGSGTPVGLLGHSMGGFLALDYLSRFPAECEFAWISSPLIDAGWNKGRWLRCAARVLGIAAPRFSISSGVSSEQCKRDPEHIRETKRDKLVHRRITMRLGRILLASSAELPGLISSMNPDLKLLLTHGSEDRICPSSLSEALFNKMPLSDKQYVKLGGLLHEPFNDVGREAFFDALEVWLGRVFPSAESSSQRAA